MYRDAVASSVSPARASWRELLSSVRTLQMELKRSEPERSVGLAGNPAAPESALVVTELRLGRKLPPSYREFLAFCDGWPNFFGGASLLGTAEIGRRTCEAAAARMVTEHHLLPFGADNRGSCLFAFDTRVRLSDGELPVVAWMGGLGIDCRCFTGFLATVLQLCRAELAQVKTCALSAPASRAAETAQKQAFSQRYSAPRWRDEPAPGSELRSQPGAPAEGPRADFTASPREAALRKSGAQRRV